MQKHQLKFIVETAMENFVFKWLLQYPAISVETLAPIMANMFVRYSRL